MRSEELVLSLESQKTLEFQVLGWNPCGWYLGFVWTTVTANAHIVWMVPVGQELSTPCESTSPAKPQLSLPGTAEPLTRVSWARLSAPGYPGCSVDQLWFLHHPFHWISLGGLEHSESLCNKGMIHTVGTLDPSLCQDQITQGWGCCSETIAETYLSTLIRVMCQLLLH